MRYRVLLGLLVVALALVALVGWAVLHRATVTIDLATRHQTIDGWEATIDLPATPSDPGIGAADYDRLLDAAVDDVGINRVRLEVRSGAETGDPATDEFFDGGRTYDEWRDYRYAVINDNDDPYVIDWDGFNFVELDYHIARAVAPLRERLEARGEKLVVNLCYVAFVSGPYVHRDPEEYAEFVLATYLYLQENHGFVPDMWEVVLEPDVMEDGWTGPEMGAAMAAAGRRLREHGFTPAFVAPSTVDMSNAVPYFRDIAAVPGVVDTLTEVSFHPYRNRSQRYLRDIAAAAEEHGLQTAMLEWWFGNGTPAVLYEDLTLAGVSAWQGRSLESSVDVVDGTGDGAAYRPRAEMRIISNIYRNVRRGAVRVGARTWNPLVQPLAFVNPDGTTTVAVLTRWAATARVEGLPAGRYRISYTTDQERAEIARDVDVPEGGSLSAEIPGRGIILVTSHPDPAG